MTADGKLSTLGRMLIDNSTLSVLYWTCCPKPVPSMTQDDNPNKQNEVLIKFLAPQRLKYRLEELAAERSIALSALLRLIASEYLRRNHPTW